MVSSTPRPHFTPGKDPVPIVQEAGWAPGPVWTGGISPPHRDSIPNRPTRIQLLYRLSYRAHTVVGSLLLNGHRQRGDQFDRTFSFICTRARVYFHLHAICNVNLMCHASKLLSMPVRIPSPPIGVQPLASAHSRSRVNVNLRTCSLLQVITQGLSPVRYSGSRPGVT